ncbi:hypothetical protein [Aurantiacibacter gilvus]|uniref:Uncharacterized protein n=1 Tax=Aurantiacibacter gilvus TaxID=3139141 RepID=A0ABU9IEM6_9SPHN
MQVHPDIAALRSDRAPQRAAQAVIQGAKQDWAQEPGASELLADLEAYGRGAPFECCAMLEAVFIGQGEAERLMDALSRHYCKAMAANPIGQPPFRNGFDGMASSILLARCERAQLMLQAREPGDMHHSGYVFSDATRFDAVLAGEAEARIVRKVSEHDGQARFAEEAVSLRPGQRYAFDLSSDTLVIDQVARRLVALRLLRTAEEPHPGREFCAASGRMLHQSAATIAISRQETILALLGRMGRTDAAPAIADLARSGGDTSLRWQAVREALALDSATGFRLLGELARRAGDPLAHQAGALRAQLLETHPELAQLEIA